MEFSNKQINIDQLPTWEGVDFKKVSPKYKYVLLGGYMIFLLVVLALIWVISLLNNVPLDGPYYLAMEIAVGLALFLCASHVWSVTYWGYALREKDMLYRSGIFMRTLQVVPYRHIQHVNVKESFLSRILSLTSIEVFTAGANKSLHIPGLNKDIGIVVQQFISENISEKGQES